MRLHIEEWGTGDRYAILLHGLSSDASTWQEVAPHLVERGFHVLAPELRGHGRSPWGDYSLSLWADDVIESVPAEPDLMIGVSFGGLIGAHAVHRLRPGRAVYIDPTWSKEADADATFAWLRQRKDWQRSDWSNAFPALTADAIDARLLAASRWDAATADLDNWGPGDTYFIPSAPEAPSLVVLPPQSRQFTPTRVSDVAQRGYFVSYVPDSVHAVHRENLTGFLTACGGWLSREWPPASG